MTISPAPRAATPVEPQSSSLRDPRLPLLLPQVFREVEAVLEKLRASRAVLEQTPVGELENTNQNLLQVTATTEGAALDIMNAVERSFEKIEALETKEGADTSEEAEAIRADLRNELYSVMGHLQFQDITTQQIHHALSILGEMEERLQQLTVLFDVRSLEREPRHLDTAERVAFDPLATVEAADLRQAVADEIFFQRP